MDFFEKAFEHFLKITKSQQTKSSSVAVLDDVAKSLQVLIGALVSVKNLKTSEAFEVVASREYIGIYEGCFFLPEKIDFFKSQFKNRQLYKYLVLLICASRNTNKRAKKSVNLSALAQRWQFLLNMYEINNYLDKQFSGFFEFQKNLLLSMKEDLMKQKIVNKKDFLTWLELSLNRDSDALQPFCTYNLKKLNEKIPDFIFFTTACFELMSDSSFLEETANSHLQKRQSPIQTEKKKSYSSIVEKVDLKKEEANPVTHSFEKLETADEYQGGRRFDSGDDQLDQHAAALDELNLSHVTTGGESAQSIYQADAVMQTLDAKLSFEKHQSVSENFYFYPEWSTKKSLYIKNYCRLVKNPLTFFETHSDVKKSLQLKYRSSLKEWQKRIASLLTSPLWVKRLEEGDELDCDEFVRDVALIQSERDIKAKWYMKKRPLLRNTSVLILFDQSWSSDSYVNEKKVLDVITDAIGVSGLLFENVIDCVSVAGTWSSTRKNCFYQEYKSCDESWASYFNKSTQIEAQGYTRLGPAIRHATSILQSWPSKKKLLLILTDGKPTDLDGYEGIHGIQDVKFACREAEACGIFPFALTVDESAKRHFPKMFKHYILLQNSQKFAEEIFKILLKLIKGNFK